MPEKPRPLFGDGILSKYFTGNGPFVLATMREPYLHIENGIGAGCVLVIFNHDMSVDNLAKLEKKRPLGAEYVAGFGGGSACDTAKYLAWKWGLPLVVAPSIISVDAWLCRSIAVRDCGRVRYVGDVGYRDAIVDFSLVKKAPKELNRAGVADIVSIATALGDWKIATEKFGEKFDSGVSDAARDIVVELMESADDIREVNEDGIRALVKGQWDEVVLCEDWGNARPEEGGEHFLAYCLEEQTGKHYIHGDLIALNVLVVLKLQGDYASFDIDEMKDFFDRAGLRYRPAQQGISQDELRNALGRVSDYVRREKVSTGLWSLENVFDESGPLSIDGISDWAFSL